MQESAHQRLQRSLGERFHGGPKEQIRSRPARLRFTRSCDILHSSLEEPLTFYKSLEPLKPHWPSTWRRYHLNDGIRVLDQDTIVINANDTLEKTKKGLLRNSSGTVTYSSNHSLKVELDVSDLANILLDGVPGGGHEWTPSKLQRIFTERTGRQGVWGHYEIAFGAFLQLFPKTFELFGPTNSEYIRLRRKRQATVLDNIEDVMVRLARSRQNGKIEMNLSNFGQTDEVSVKASSLPELKNHRLKAVYVPLEDVMATSTMRSTSNPLGTKGFEKWPHPADD